ncbi:MAG: polyprenyl synthetase family protein [Acidiferrobacterales bacterium]|nr:polyprenyl synthetase family protein [Acidiferrobacterales bacterium]
MSNPIAGISDSCADANPKRDVGQSDVRHTTENSKQQLSQIRSFVQDDLDAMQDYVLEALDSDIPLIQDVGRHIVEHGGKKMRPITVLLGARVFDYPGPHHVMLATILEFIHVATLLHDDVVDDSTMRRGRASAKSIWGNPASVLVGDFFSTRAFELLVSADSLKLFEVMTSAMRKVAEGEVLQLVQMHAYETTQKDYFDTIDRKTAPLFWAGAQLGAIITGQPQDVRHNMAQFGYNLGMAFQLIDDYLDYAGDTETIGKEVGDDLMDGKMTLPLIYARDHCKSQHTETIRSAVDNPDETKVAGICEIVASSGALEYTVSLACKYRDSAIENLRFLPDSACKEVLFKLIEFAVSRDF